MPLSILPVLVAVYIFFKLAACPTAPNAFTPPKPPTKKLAISPIVPKPVSVGLKVACKSFWTDSGTISLYFSLTFFVNSGATASLIKPTPSPRLPANLPKARPIPKPGLRSSSGSVFNKFWYSRLVFLYSVGSKPLDFIYSVRSSLVWRPPCLYKS